MHLQSIKYRQYENAPKYWTLEPVALQAINLIVGKNASGKSRALNVTAALANMISGRQKELTISGNYDVIFEHQTQSWRYELHFENRRILSEKLTRGDTVLLTRGEGGIGSIFSEEARTLMKFQSPDTSLAVVTRQDSIQHPYLQSLIDWANGTFHYQFGTPMGQQSLLVIIPQGPPADPHDMNQTTGIFRRGEKEFGPSFKNEVLAAMAKVGYALTDVGIMTPESIIVQGAVSASQIIALFVQETQLKARTEQFEMSQGMFRALATIIHMTYEVFAKASGCIIIDDVGEGLDFERSTSLIEVLIDKAQKSGVQLIMTSNDRLVMNAVPLEYWTVLNREGSIVRVHNRFNSANKFEDFRFTGLSNFDFFASDFIESEETEAPK